MECCKGSFTVSIRHSNVLIGDYYTHLLQCQPLAKTVSSRSQLRPVTEQGKGDQPAPLKRIARTLIGSFYLDRIRELPFTALHVVMKMVACIHLASRLRCLNLPTLPTSDATQTTFTTYRIVYLRYLCSSAPIATPLNFCNMAVY